MTSSSAAILPPPTPTSVSLTCFAPLSSEEINRLVTSNYATPCPPPVHQVSDSWTNSTASPQGCILSPLLFSLYTNACTSSHLSVKLLKSADDTNLIGLISGGDESAYRWVIGPSSDLVWSEQLGAQRSQDSGEKPSPSGPHHPV